MKSSIISNKLVTFCYVTFLALVVSGYYAYAYTPLPIQRVALSSLTPKPTPTRSPARPSAPVSQLEQVETIVREYCRLASQGQTAEIERIIQVIAPKQPVLSKKEKRTGATVPNFGIFADFERANLLEDTPRWIALGSKSIVSLKVKFDTDRSASVNTMLSSRELPGISRNLLFKLSDSGSGWKINAVVWEFEGDEGNKLKRTPSAVSQF